MKKVNYGHRWTDVELKELMRMWADGIELTAIADALGCSRHAINKMVLKLRREGIPLPRRMSGHVAGRRNLPWTQSEVEFLIRRRKEAATAEQIAVEIDRTFLSVQNMIQTLRKEGVEVRMLGCGVRRLWNPETLKAAAAGGNL